MKKSITVIGAGGKMGQWFAKYFTSIGYEVVGFDSETPITDKTVKKASSLVGSVLSAEIVLLCTPTRRTPEIIRLIAKEMRRGSYLIEISSQKAKTAAALLKIPSKINPVCIHPMFGPGTKKLKGQNIISIPIKDAKKELSLTKSLFEGANFVTIDAIEHDKKIAIILGLTHLVNLAFANILAKDDKTSLTERMSGNTFKIQKILTESIMTESTELIETIISNPEIRRAAEEFWKDVGRMLTDIQEGKSEDINNYIRT
ncbi:MAG: prephenate dehydrogenase/arogenate dehydrogenase family protein, partial [Candidatus Nitrosotenuis sp.]